MNKFSCLFGSKYSLRQKFGQKCYSQRYGFAASLVEHLEETELQAKYKPIDRLPVKPPFVKNLFRGKFDTDFLAFPEFMPEARVELLERNAEVVRKLVDDNVDPARIDGKAAVPDELIEKLASLKLFGLMAPRSVGGAEFTHTERARIMEIVGESPSVGVLLFQNETLGHKLIAAYGDDYQKEKLLKSLITGKKYATLCFGEANCGSDATKFETQAVRSGTDWLLRGTKVWVPNADNADLFIVVAKIRLTHETPQNPYYAEEGEEPFTPEDVGFFLVERNAANVRVGPRYDTVGLRGVPMCEVTFDNVVVPDAMVLTDFFRGYDVVKRMFAEDRYAIGSIALATLKRALKEAAEYSVQRRVRDVNLYQYEFAQRRLGRMALQAYAIESVIYFTTGIMDMYEGQDCEVENAIAKVFCTEAALAAVNDAMQLMGGQALLEDSSFTRYHRDLRALTLFDHHNDLYRGLIALNSLQYISAAVSDTIMAKRNPLFYTMKNFRSTFTMRFMKNDEDDPHLYLRLKDNLHPSLMFLADQLEACVLRFEHAIIKTLSMLGPETVHDQMYLRRIADCASLLYTMTAVLSRASRAYCIGSENADDELVLAETFVRDSHDSFKELVNGLHYGEYYVTDHNFKRLSHRTVESKKYFLPEPYKLNY